MPSVAEFTLLLERARKGDTDAESALFPLVYEQLRSAAKRIMSGERKNHTLTPTELVHDAYVKLAGPGTPVSFESRHHFLSVAAAAMRRHLIDHARARMAQKRGGPGEDHADGTRWEAVPLSEVSDIGELATRAEPEDILKLDQLLTEFEGLDPRAASVVYMRVFAGLSVEHTAEALGISVATVKRDWTVATAWLGGSFSSR